MQLSQIDIIHQKKLVRTELKSKRATLSQSEHKEKSLALCQNIFSKIISKKYKTALLFSPAKQEPDISDLSEMLRNAGIATAFPVSHRYDIRLEFRLVDDDSDFIIGEYGIREPNPNCPTLIDFSNSVCIAPALAIDLYGMRIGYGMGYYDRFLKEFHGARIGVVFSDFVVDKLPVDDKDIPLELIITEREVLVPHEKHQKEYLPLEGEKR